ncbi:MAG: ornithine carbamoyltransferase [Gammaproteobacteria bacterium]
MTVKHFLTLKDLPASDVLAIVKRASELKKDPTLVKSQSRKTLGLIFEKSSTRTRVAFEVAMTQMDGHSLFVSHTTSQLGRGEPLEDASRVLSRMVDCLAIRTYAHGNLELFAEYSRVPIINALSDDFHPCQLLADVQTFMEHRGDIRGAKVAWIGDGNNMCQSYINAAEVFDFSLHIGCPEGYEPNAELLAQHSDRVQLSNDAVTAARGADLVVTDVWASMGQEQEQQLREEAFASFVVDHNLLSIAADNVLFMHCLPAHRGEEVSAELMEDAASVIWDEAENRMHSQKALLEYLLD